VSKDQTPRLGLSMMLASQADKHVTLNMALEKLDALIGVQAITRALTQPIAAAEAGDIFLLSNSGQGVWSGYPKGTLAYYSEAGWTCVGAPNGTLLFVLDEGITLLKKEGDWVPLGSQLGSIAIGMAPAPDAPMTVAGPGMKLVAKETGPDAGSVSARLSRTTQTGQSTIIHETLGAARFKAGLIGSNAYKIQACDANSVWNDAVSISSDGTMVRFADCLTLAKSGSISSISKDEDSALSIGPVGSTETNNPFWKGLHLAAPMHESQGKLFFPRLSIYFQSDKISAATRLECKLELGNLIPNVASVLTLDPGSNGRIQMKAPMQLISYAPTSLPSASSVGIGSLIHVTGSPSGLAWSDGTVWRWASTNVAI
jgi:hypothetical protein